VYHSTDPAGVPLKGDVERTRSTTSLDPLETAEQSSTCTGVSHDFKDSPWLPCKLPDQFESQFRHSGWAPTRKRVYHALKAVHSPYKRLERFACCGASLWAERRDDGSDLRLKADHCHDRWCIPCQRQRATIVAGNIRRQLQLPELRFWTFTLRHSHTPLTDQLNRLMRSFKELRRRQLWKGSVSGGLAIVEVTLGRDKLWHPHLHVIIQGSWMDQITIAEAWHQITGDSSIVFVKRVIQDSTLDAYLAKYLTKPVSHGVYTNDDKLQEAIISIRGVRQIITFGTWTRLRLVDPPKDVHQWKPIGAVTTIFRHAAQGDPESIRYAAALLRKWPSLAIFEHPPPHSDTP
jgi:Replication protein